MNKKGFFITPIIFIVFFIIAVLFSYHVSGIDNEIAYGIQKTSSIQKGIHDIQKEQLSQIYFVKTAVYMCRETENTCEAITLQQCTRDVMEDKFGTNMDLKITNNSGVYHVEFNMQSFSAKNINMTSDSVEVKTELNKQLINCS